MRDLSVLDLVILFYSYFFFLGREAQKVREWGVNSLKTSIFLLPSPLRVGREAQKVREWGVNSLKTSIFPLPTPLRGCRSLLEIVFCRTV